MNIQQVRITTGNGWYTDLEGEVFTVYDNCGRDFILCEDYDLGHDHYWRHIDNGDCELVESEGVLV